MSIPDDFSRLLPQRTAEIEHDDRPPIWLWVYDPQDASVIIKDGEGDGRPAHYVTHGEMSEHIHHPEKQQGYAYPIKDGWRITDDHHKKVEDPFLLKRIRAGLRKEHPPAPLPSIRYHGDPR